MSLLVAAAAFVLYFVAYHTYGRFLARRIFGLRAEARTPAHELEDGVDYVPSRKEVVFGHHFTSIAGTGPIVGPALAVIWGWLPALLWVVFGCILMGAVHDFGALVVSLRHQGKSVADVCARLVNPRVRVLFLAIVTFSLIIVIAIFCLVIANIFKMYPDTVFPVWMEIPIAIGLGLIIRRCRSVRTVILWGVAAVLLMYVTVWMGAELESLHVTMPTLAGFGPVVIWSVILLVYCFIASVLPVQTLLQPRDYINAYQLYIALGLLGLGLVVSRPEFAAPATNFGQANTPSPWPLLFVTVACGAISGFHALVSGGTTSKQLSRETDAKAIGYGSMILEGVLAVLVLIAAGAGLGLDYNARIKVDTSDPAEEAEGLAVVEEFRRKNPDVALSKDKADGAETYTSQTMTGRSAFDWHYRGWLAAKGLADKIDAFVRGASNMIQRVGGPFTRTLCLTIMGVFIASFAGTTLDTATRLQRYIITELGDAVNIAALRNRYLATFVTVLAAGGLALWDGKGAGALILWPLFGTVNQLIAALALMVISVYLYETGKPIWATAIPFVIMIFLTGWAMIYNCRAFLLGTDFVKRQPHLFVIGLIVGALEVWMVVEVVLHVRRKKREAAAAT